MKKRSFYTMLLVFMLALAANIKLAAHDKVQKETYIFAIKGQDTLSLDKYEVLADRTLPAKPVLLFAFGGGFKGGERDAGRYVPFFEFLAENGFVVVSTDYRTALKNPDPKQLSTTEGFVAALQNAIFVAVEDFYDATNYVMKNSPDWNIDPQKIIACGSSAGAITVLQAEYELCNKTDLSKRLPGSFNYAGVVSFAGAICSLGNMQWQVAPCPMMLFHGDADKTVPYDKAVIEGLGGLWGSASIIDRLESMEVPYYFYKVENAGHSIADTPLKNNKYDVLSFLTKLVLEKRKVVMVTDEKVPGEEPVKKDFTIIDYIRDNMN